MNEPVFACVQVIITRRCNSLYKDFGHLYLSPDPTW